MKKRILQECPACGGNLQVRVLYCPDCQIRIEGKFVPPKSKLLYLSRKELEFVELFMRVRGNIKEVEKALGVSYPTVRGMLDSVIRSMGYSITPSPDAGRRLEIIEQLEKGQINAEKAASMLKTGSMEDEAAGGDEHGGNR